jgi:hypothetical protein
MRNLLSVALVFLIGCSLDAATEDVTSSEQHSETVTRIKVNGRSASFFLVDDDGTNGILTVTEDQIAHTKALDFSFATPDSNPDFVILFQGAGEIPNNSYTQSGLTSAHLVFTTGGAFVVNRCVVNVPTGEFTCAPAAPLVFDLTWVKNSLGSVHETTKRKEVLGPVTTKFNGEFSSKTATVNGTWAGHSAADQPGSLMDTESSTHIREITVQNP